MICENRERPEAGPGRTFIGGKKMKAKRSTKTIALVLAFAMVLTFTVFMPVSAKTSGGWSVSKARYSFLNKDQKVTFKKAINEMTGVSYKPVAVLAKQVVAGTNYIYLAQGKTVTAKPKSAWYILSAYKALDNEVSLNSSKKINLSKIKTNKNPRTETTSGGLEIVKVKKSAKALSKKAWKVFKKGTKKYVGYSLRPITLLGTQIVAGKNYRFLCYASGHAGKDIFVVDIYENLKGKCKITLNEPLNLEGYL